MYICGVKMSSGGLRGHAGPSDQRSVPGDRTWAINLFLQNLATKV